MKPAITSKSDAIRLSIRHWKENIEKIKDGTLDFYENCFDDSCPLCQKYMSCHKCPLGEVDCCGNTGSTWENFIDNPTVENAEAMVKVLRSLL